MEQALDAVAKTAGRICRHCTGTIALDDLEADLRGDGLCSRCRELL